MNKLNEYADLLDAKIKQLDIYDMGILKLSVLSVGLIFGSIYSKTIKKLAPVLGAIAFLGSAFLIIKVFFKDSVPYYKIRD